MHKGCEMKRNMFLICLLSVPTLSSAESNVIELLCPTLDDRAPDLKVILDKANSTASLQEKSNMPALNFTEKASFGSENVTWRKDNKSFKQTYSVSRSNLELERSTISVMTGKKYTEKSSCSINKSREANKF